MPKETKLRILENKEINRGVYEISLGGEVSSYKPGQFVDLMLKKHFLRRPLSIYRCKENSLSLIYKIVGEGTKDLSELRPGEALSVLAPLGHGFDLEKCKGHALLIGGGMGSVPLVFLASELMKENVKVKVVLGFNCAEEIILAEEFSKIGIEPLIATMDGSRGEKGFVTDAIKKNGLAQEYFYCCGPMAMMRAVFSTMKKNGQFSLEERMGCGFGVCMGCSIMTKNGAKRVCHEGPVFDKEELLWSTQE